MGEFVDFAVAQLQAVQGELEQRFGNPKAPRCSCCGAVRAVYGRKHEPKFCRPCMYLTTEERRIKAFKWMVEVYDYSLDLRLAKLAVRRAELLERILALLLQREIDASRPYIKPTGFHIVGGLDITAARFKRYLDPKP